MFLGISSGTVLLCYTVPRDTTLWVTLGEDTASLLDNTVKGDVYWTGVVDRLRIWTSWMKEVVVGCSKVRDGILLFLFRRMYKMSTVA